MQESEVTKFFKHLAGRLVHGLVAARLGQPQTATLCSAKSDDAGDWFNLRICELSDVASQIRCATAAESFPPHARSVSVDFHASTPHALVLPLESWHLSLSDWSADRADAWSTGRPLGGTVQSAVYHQMGVLLRSALCAARATPAYRQYMRRQSPDTCVILYEIYSGPSQLDRLGSDCKTVTIGTVPTPCGSVTLELSYRTQLSLSSLLDADQQCAMVKQDAAHVPVSNELIVKPVDAQHLLSGNKCNESWRNDSPTNIASSGSPNEPAICSFSTSPARGVHVSQPVTAAGRQRQSSVSFQLGSSPMSDAPVAQMSTGHSASTGHISASVAAVQPAHVKRNDSASGLFFHMDSDTNMSQSQNTEGAVLRRLSVGRMASTHNVVQVQSALREHSEQRDTPALRHAQSGTWAPSASGGSGAGAGRVPRAGTPRSLPSEHTHMQLQLQQQQLMARQRKASAGASFPFASLLAASYSAPSLDAAHAAAQQVHSCSSATGLLGVKSPLPRLTEDESNGGPSTAGNNNGDGDHDDDTGSQADGGGDEPQTGEVVTSKHSGYSSDESDDSFVKLPSAAVFAQQHGDSYTSCSSSAAAPPDRLGDFVAQCKSAPQKLRSFAPADDEASAGGSQSPDSLCDQLKALASRRGEFDQFVKSLQDEQ